MKKKTDFHLNRTVALYFVRIEKNKTNSIKMMKFEMKRCIKSLFWVKKSVNVFEQKVACAKNCIVQCDLVIEIRFSETRINLG